MHGWVDEQSGSGWAHVCVDGWRDALVDEWRHTYAYAWADRWRDRHGCVGGWVAV